MPITPVPAEAFNIAPFKDAHKGERCFILGNGPSLKNLDLSLLAGEITFAGNNFWTTKQLRWWPTYYSVIEEFVLARFHKQINAYKGPTKFYPHFSWNFWIHRRWIKPDYQTYFVPADNAVFPDKSIRMAFSTDASKVCWCGATVVYFLMQLAYYMGCSPIYVIGVDLSEGHFIPDAKYFPGRQNEFAERGIKWAVITKFFVEARRVMEGHKRRIFNATPGGNLEAFERVRFGTLF